MKVRITLDVNIDSSGYEIINTNILPILEEEPVQEPQPVVEPVIEPIQPQRVPTPAPIGNQATQGKGNWFAGTTWGR